MGCAAWPLRSCNSMGFAVGFLTSCISSTATHLPYSSWIFGTDGTRAIIVYCITKHINNIYITSIHTLAQHPSLRIYIPHYLWHSPDHMCHFATPCSFYSFFMEEYTLDFSFLFIGFLPRPVFFPTDDCGSILSPFIYDHTTYISSTLHNIQTHRVVLISKNFTLFNNSVFLLDLASEIYDLV